MEVSADSSKGQRWTFSLLFFIDTSPEFSLDDNLKPSSCSTNSWSMIFPFPAHIAGQWHLTNATMCCPIFNVFSCNGSLQAIGLCETKGQQII